MKMKLISFLAVVAMFLVACDGGHMPSKQTMGGVLGGVAGGVAGGVLGGQGNTIAIVAGTLLGAALGSSIGSSMDQEDLYRTQSAFETGRPMSWRNPSTQYQYQVNPTNSYRGAGGQLCRNYTINGQNGTACRQANGSWRSR
jgi:surface antigen